MKVFITGGTGFIGAEVVKELAANGHEVLGLARSDAAKQTLSKLGAAAVGGSVEDLDSLKRGARDCDAVIHCAFVHDFANFAACCETDKNAINALGEAVENRSFIVTSGVPNGAPGHVVSEDDKTDGSTPRQSESAALRFANVRIVRPSRFVYDENLSNGFIAALIGTALQKGVSAYAGTNNIHAVHVRDLAKLYVLALEKGVRGGVYHGVGDGSVAFRGVAEAIGKRLNLPVQSIAPEQAAAHFGFLGAVVCADNPASSEKTRNALGWNPIEPGFLEVI